MNDDSRQKLPNNGEQSIDSRCVPTDYSIESSSEPTSNQDNASYESAALSTDVRFAPYLIDGLQTIVCDSSVNFRMTPDTDGELIGRLHDGTSLSVLGYNGIYAYVDITATHKKGYVVAGYIKPIQNILKLDVVSVKSTYTYEDMCMDMDELVKMYSDDVKLVSAGMSVQGRELYVLVIGAKSAKYNVFVQAGIHGREHMTSLLAMMLAEDWLRQGANESIRFHVMPMSNPDGVMISERGKFDDMLSTIYQLDLLDESTRLSGSKYLRQWKANANGVDLNRNFNAGWENINSPNHPSYEGYKGVEYESEPETNALITYTEQNNFDLTLSYHATGSLIYWEFGDREDVNEKSFEIAKMLQKMSAYELCEDDGTSFGGYRDWAIEKMGIPSLTVEIGTRTAPLPLTDINNIWLRNKFTFRTILSWLKLNGENGT